MQCCWPSSCTRFAAEIVLLLADGKLSEAEIVQMLGSVGSARQHAVAMAMVRAADTHHDGMVTKQELRVLLLAKRIHNTNAPI